MDTIKHLDVWKRDCSGQGATGFAHHADGRIDALKGYKIIGLWDRATKGIILK